MGIMVYSLLWVILGSAGFAASTVGTTLHTPDPGAIWRKKLLLVGEPEPKHFHPSTTTGTWTHIKESTARGGNTY